MKVLAAKEEVTQTLSITGSVECVERIKALLGLLQLNGAWGHSGVFGIWWDGDGSDQVDITGVGFNTSDYVDMANALHYGGDVECVGENGVGYVLMNDENSRHVKSKTVWPPETANVDDGANETNTEPTPAQIKSGNYKKGKISVGGLKILIENPAGSVRSGPGWEQVMNDHYGYFQRTEGSDGDAVDVFVKPQTDESWQGTVYVVDQVDPETREFDEHKVMLGYDTKQEAHDAYLSNYEDGWQGVGAVHAVPFGAFDAWLSHGDTTVPLSPVLSVLASAQKRLAR